MKQMIGLVTSNKMTKTVGVTVSRRWTHPVYRKTVTRRKKYLVQADMVLAVGDKVMIQETRPLSKNKKWTVIKKL